MFPYGVVDRRVDVRCNFPPSPVHRGHQNPAKTGPSHQARGVTCTFHSFQRRRSTYARDHPAKLDQLQSNALKTGRQGAAEPHHRDQEPLFLSNTGKSRGKGKIKHWSFHVDTRSYNHADPELLLEVACQSLFCRP